MLRFTRGLLGVLLLAGAVAACDDEPATPTQPAPVPVTDTFPGTVGSNDAKSHDFPIATSGTVTATLKTIGSDNTLVVGFNLGTWNTTTSSCTVVFANDAATAGAVLTGTMTNAGAGCVRIYDVGNIAASTSAAYSIEVVHP